MNRPAHTAAIPAAELPDIAALKEAVAAERDYMLDTLSEFVRLPELFRARRKKQRSSWKALSRRWV